MIPKYKKRSHDTTLSTHIPELESNPNPQVILLGTSMFERFRYMPEAQRAWKKCQLDQYNIFNCGVGGDQICNILYRLQTLDILNHIKTCPRLTILMAGANDIEKGNIDEMVNGMQQIIRHVKTKFPATNMCVLGMYPRKSDKYTEADVYKRVVEYNQKLKEHCNGVGIAFQYYGDDILGPTGNIDLNYFVDNVHFSGRGYNRFAERLRALIKI